VATQHDHVASVQLIFEALRRGDASSLLEILSDDVDWEFGGVDYGIPWLVPGRGKDHVRKFLQAMRLLEVRRFTINAVFGAGPWVVALVETESIVRATGKRIFEQCQPMVWQFNDAGRVVAVRHAADTHQHYLATQNDA
jgi:ketosteroid isomerase-like protein